MTAPAHTRVPTPAARPDPDAAPAAVGCRMCGGGALRRLGAVNGHDFVECARCAFAFAPAVTPETMTALYAAGYHGTDDGAPDAGWTSTGFLGPALDRLWGDRRPLRILDFGTGQSWLPRHLRARGHRVVAVDVAPPVEQHPDRLTGDLPELGLAPAQFDLAVAFQVFEHLPEPRPALFELLRMTRPGGLVLVHTDMETPERDERGFAEWWYVAPPDHCSFFRHRTFEVALAPTPHRMVRRDAKSVLIEAGRGRPPAAAQP